MMPAWDSAHYGAFVDQRLDAAGVRWHRDIAARAHTEYVNKYGPEPGGVAEKPQDPLDADHIERVHRGTSALERAGVQVHQSDDPYQTHLSVDHASGHRVLMQPSQNGGWNAEVYHPDSPTNKHSAHLDVPDTHLASALQVHMARPDVRAAMKKES